LNQRIAPPGGQYRTACLTVTAAALGAVGLGAVLGGPLAAVLVALVALPALALTCLLALPLLRWLKPARRGVAALLWGGLFGAALLLVFWLWHLGGVRPMM
jgi:hypothetical protein